MKSSKKEEFKSREKSSNNSHSIKPFNSQKSSNQWMIIKYPFLSLKKGSQPMSRLGSQMKKLRKDY